MIRLFTSILLAVLFLLSSCSTKDREGKLLSEPFLPLTNPLMVFKASDGRIIVSNENDVTAMWGAGTIFYEMETTGFVQFKNLRHIMIFDERYKGRDSTRLLFQDQSRALKTLKESSDKNVSDIYYSEQELYLRCGDVVVVFSRVREQDQIDTVSGARVIPPSPENNVCP